MSIVRQLLNFLPISLCSSNLGRYRQFNPLLRTIRCQEKIFFSSNLFTSTTAGTEPTKFVSLDSGLSLTSSCIERLHQISSATEPYLRITISGGGCSGFQYGFEMDSLVGPDDRLIGDDSGRALVVVDSVSLSYISGSTIDYYEELIKTGFRIMSNPQAGGGCSCGASFSIKM